MFRMASNTKPLIATGISILRDENKLDYNVKFDTINFHLIIYIYEEINNFTYFIS